METHSNVKIIAVSNCGTYSSWIDYVIGSVYNSVDAVVVVNGGYITEKPELGNCNILERERDLLKEIDIDKKVFQFSPNNDKLEQLGFYKEGRDELARAGNMTLSIHYAYAVASKKGWDFNNLWIMKLDSDQICDSNFTRENLIDLTDSSRVGFRFAQYADFYRRFDRIQALPDWVAGKEGDFTNDGSLFFKANLNAHIGCQGSPSIPEEFPINDLRTYHMRRIHPQGVDEYEYHYKRFWYHTYGPNSIMEYGYNRDTGKSMTLEQIHKEADILTKGILENKGHNREHFNNDIRFPASPPEIVEKGVLNYINGSYPK